MSGRLFSNNEQIPNTAKLLDSSHLEASGNQANLVRADADLARFVQGFQADRLQSNYSDGVLTVNAVIRRMPARLDGKWRLDGSAILDATYPEID